MSGRRISRRTVRDFLVLLALDVFLTQALRFRGGCSWLVSLTVGGVVLAVNLLLTASSLRRDFHPEKEEQLMAGSKAYQARVAERSHREALANEAAMRRRDRIR